MEKIKGILTFWFDNLNDDILLNNHPTVKKWFTKNEQFDKEIKERFESDLLLASRGEYKEWKEHINGQLALVILFDQFSRNIYRNTPKMFESDSLALDLTLRSIKEKRDGRLKLIERIFLYMPLMHAEDLKIQELSLKYFGALVEESKKKNPQNTPYFEYTLDYAKRHHATIEKFGRFPHRNSILARETTPEESEFLKKPQSGF